MNATGRRLALALVAAVLLGLPVLSQSPARATSDEVTLRLIVVSTDEQATQVAARLKDGENFALLARAVSIDPSSSQGGLIGKISVASLRPELRAALAGLAPGQLSPIVRLPTGFAVLEILPDGAAAARANPNGYPALDATGAVKYALDAGGLAEVETSLDRFPLPDRWNEDPKTICAVRTQAYDSMHQALDRFVSPAGAREPAPASPSDAEQAQYAIGQLDLYQGDMAAAIARFEKAYQIASTRVSAAVPDLLESLGIAHLHKAQIDNDVFRAPADRCLLPMPPGRAFAKPADAQRAVEYFTRYLRLRPDDLEARWLLNLAYMAIGRYPSGVPARFLIPPSALASEENVGRFADVAPRAGLASFQMAGGVIVDDLENNGRLDVVTSSFNSCVPMKLYHNNGDGTFSDRTAQSGLADQLGGLNILQTDYNNDGCLDMLVLRGGWEVAQRKSLLRNNCNGTFTDVTVAARLGQPTSTQTAVWTDIDNDGFLDLFVGNEDGPAQLFLNKRDGTFEDISHAAGIDRNVVGKGVTAGDYDNDGYPDLFISNLTGNSVLFHNNHDRTFTDVSASAGVPGADRSFATWFFDYDNDGWPDLFAANYFVSIDEVVRTYLHLPHNATPMRLYRNLGNGTFRDVTKQVGLDRVFMTMGAGFGDIDNDGFPDIYLGSGSPAYTSLLHAVLLHNKGGQSFTDVSASSGTAEMHKGHGVAFADLDNDGDEDLIFVVGGATPGDAHALRVFENPGHGNDWLGVKLVGVKTNRPGIGARIAVTVQNGGGPERTIYKTVGSGGSFGASPLLQHIGLGKSARIVSLEVWWPASNTRQRFTNVGTNQAIEITEFARDDVKLERPPVRLGGGPRAQEARQ